MKAWSRAEQETLCGFCKRPIYREQPIFTVKPAELSRGKVRCRECAWEPVPKDLPALPITQPRTLTPLVNLGAVARGSLPLDWKKAAGGDA